MNYPNNHKEIVTNLLDGKFIIYPSSLFIAIQEQPEEYKEFFRQSFGYELNIETEFVYLSSEKVNEKSTRDFVLFLAVLCRELLNSGKNFKEMIELETFNIEATEQLLKQSSKWEILEKSAFKDNDLDKFLNKWNNKNVIEKKGDQFKFSKAVKLFFTFAVDIANAKLKEEQSNL